MHTKRRHFRMAAVTLALATAITALALPGAASAAPMVSADRYSLGAAESFTTADGAGILANDTEVDLPGRVILVTNRPTHGTLALSDNSGRFSYTPNLGFVGIDTFTYCISLGAGCVTNEAIVTLDVVAHLERIGEADRFAESAAISASRFGVGPAVVFVASGEVFPDALSAGAAAGALGVPVLLVKKEVIPEAIQRELTRLHPGKVVILGGLNTISAAAEALLATYAGTVLRYSGADRYEVSATISAKTFLTAPPVVYIASGEVFPDALSAAAAAGRSGAPVLLVGKDAVPDVIAAELARLAPPKIVVLGGANTVSDGVVAKLQAIAPTTRISGTDRYEVSANTSAGTFLFTKGVVFIASGGVFPDALSGSPAAIARQAPVLLVSKDSIPDSIAAELRRIGPSRIVVLGGPNSISPQVESELRGYLLH